MDGASAATQVTTILSRYISSVKSVQSARTQLLDQIRLITAIERVVLNAPCLFVAYVTDPQLQALIDEWSKADGALARCKRELETLTIWQEAQVVERRTRNRWAKSLVWPVMEDKIRTTVVPGKLTLRQRQATTGGWLFKEELYIDWRTKFIWLRGKGRFLIIRECRDLIGGIAGAGKSVPVLYVVLCMSANISLACSRSPTIDDLSNRLAVDETLVYFYCDFRNSRCTSAEEVLRSLIK